MPVAAIAGASLIGGVMQSRAASKATSAQSKAADQQVALQREIYNDTSQKFQPYLNAGGTGLQAYMSELGLGNAPKGYGGFEATPGYQFQLDQGLSATNALAGARGGLNSGRTMQALQDYGSGLASQEYGNYMNRLAGLTDMGQASAGNMAAAGNAYASGAGNALAGKGNAQAAGAIGGANAWSGALNNGIAAYQYQTMLNRAG